VFLQNAAERVHVQLPIDPFFYGVIAMGVFVLLAVVTWSYRDVANRHDHKSSGNQGHH
jgi:heme/copper-type cytochrome/quinol oxidase subunit 2